MCFQEIPESSQLPLGDTIQSLEKLALPLTFYLLFQQIPWSTDNFISKKDECTFNQFLNSKSMEKTILVP